MSQPSPGHDAIRSGSSLRRELGLFDAVFLGLGSIVGTGVYVSLGFVIDLGGGMTIPAILVAGLIALCNGLSSAQLAAVHPVAGGTYEYGYQFLGPWRGRLAGWLFLVAKTASAATAALGLVAAAGMSPSHWVTEGAITFNVGPASTEQTTNDLVTRLWDLETETVTQHTRGQGLVAAVLIASLGALTHLGLRRATWANTIFVVLGIAPLLAFVLFVGVLPRIEGLDTYSPSYGNGFSAGAAVALAFVAFTGYGRVATLGEEVHDPRHTIPRAMVLTLLVCLVLYGAVAWSCFAVTSGNFGATYYGNRPLLAVIQLWNSERSALYYTVMLGGIAAMLGVVLNLILGLSRVVLAMARRGDLPARLATIHADGRSPGWAVLVVTIGIMTCALLGGIRTSWTVSAVTVLIYYALTNWAAMRVPPEDRFIPSAVSAAGLAGCIFFTPFALFELLAAR